jgi:hypothetical protein
MIQIHFSKTGWSRRKNEASGCPSPGRDRGSGSLGCKGVLSCAQLFLSLSCFVSIPSVQRTSDRPAHSPIGISAFSILVELVGHLVCAFSVRVCHVRRGKDANCARKISLLRSPSPAAFVLLLAAGNHSPVLRWPTPDQERETRFQDSQYPFSTPVCSKPRLSLYSEIAGLLDSLT